MAMDITSLDQEKLKTFGGTVLNNMAGTGVTIMTVLGDRLGLFEELASGGPATSAELAARTGLQERYLREWLANMACAGYLELDEVTGRFTLPPEHVPFLAEEGGPSFTMGFHQLLISGIGVLDQVEEAFGRGGGVPMPAYNKKANFGPKGTIMSAFSTMYCMTTSLADGGAGLGTLGFPPGVVRQMCAQAGFGEVRQVPINHPFHNLYEIEA